MPHTDLRGKRYLVTGGGGFMGYHLVRRLLSLGAQAAVIEPSPIVPWRLIEAAGHIGLYAADVTDTQRVADVMEAVRPDGVFHLAAYGVNSADQDIREALRINVTGILNVLDAMKRCGCDRVVTMGSGAEYGGHEGPIAESDPLHPQSIYGSAKAAATVVAHQYARQHDIGIVTLRPFGIYGEAEPRHKLFCEVILTLLDGRPLELTPCGQCRDYCHAADIASALTACMADESLRDNVFNAGSGELRSLKEYVELIRALIDPSGDVRYGALPYRKDEVFAPAPDTRLIREQLGWRPAVSLDQGLKRTVDWFRVHRDKYR